MPLPSNHKVVDKVTKALQASNPASEARDDGAVESATLHSLTDDALYQVFSTGKRGSAPMPVWPNEDVQFRYTWGVGASLVSRARNFVELMERDGALRPGSWKGLDYGCGWGRISSYMLTRGEAEQLDLCDVWPDTLELLRATNSRNNIFWVPEFLDDNSLPSFKYDVFYAFSVFTHLSRTCFGNNIQKLLLSLRPGGKLFITVWHEEFFARLGAPASSADREAFHASGFWHRTVPGQTYYGETIVSPSFLQLHFGESCNVAYLGCSEACQHCYRLAV